MSIKDVWAVWFSGTGTTEKIVTTAAERISGLLGVPYHEYCFNKPEARKKALCFADSDLVVFGVPTYAGRIPNLILPYIKDMVHGKSTLTVPVVLYGNRNFDDALIELRDVLFSNGFLPMAAGAFVGEHSFSRTLGAGRPDEEDMGLIYRLSEAVCEHIFADDIPDVPVEVEGCRPIRPYYTPRDRNGNPINILKVKPKTDPKLCDHCGLCADLCPMDAIDHTDVTLVPGKCIKCCACVKKCPTGAKYYDDAGYLYHQHELEEIYGGRRAESKIFV